jgi:hypothetical protein
MNATTGTSKKRTHASVGNNRAHLPGGVSDTLSRPGEVKCGMNNYSSSEPIARAELTDTGVAELAEFAANAELADLSAQLPGWLADLTNLAEPELVAERTERTKLTYLADLPDLAERNSPDRAKLTDLADLADLPEDAHLTDLAEISKLAKLSELADLRPEANLAELPDLTELADLSDLAHDADLRKARIAVGSDVTSLDRGKLVDAAHLREDLRGQAAIAKAEVAGAEIAQTHVADGAALAGRHAARVRGIYGSLRRQRPGACEHNAH